MKRERVKTFTKKECQGGYFLVEDHYLDTDKTYFYVKEFIDGADREVTNLVKGFSFMTGKKSGTFIIFPNASTIWWDGNVSKVYRITKEEFQDAYDNARKLADKKFPK